MGRDILFLVQILSITSDRHLFCTVYFKSNRQILNLHDDYDDFGFNDASGQVP